MLKSLTIQNYRSCLDTTFSPQSDLSVLIGPNGSGKTNILNAIMLLQKLAHDEIGLFSHAEPPTNESTLELTFAIGDKSGRLSIEANSYTDERNNDVIVDSSQSWYLWDFAQTRKRFEVPLVFVRYLSDVRHSKRAQRLRYSRVLFNQLRENEEELPRNVLDPMTKVADYVSAMRYYSASKFTNPAACPVSFEIEQEGARSRGLNIEGHGKFLYDLYLEWQEKTSGFQEFRDIVTGSGIGLVDDIGFKELKTSSVDYSVRSGGRVQTRSKDKLLVVPQFNIGGRMLSPNQLSEGTFKTITLLFYLVTETSNVLLIEEPEVCVHHGLLSSIISLIQNYADRKQIFISTHSDFVLDQVEPENVYMVSNLVGKGTTVRHVPSTMSDGELTALRSYLRTEGNLGEYWRHGGIDW